MAQTQILDLEKQLKAWHRTNLAYPVYTHTH